MARKVAIAIGVNKTGGFTELPGAAAGTHEFADWAEEAGYEVHRFIDSDTPVRRIDIYETIREASNGSVSKLLIFFSGHGLATSIDADFWVLSNAEADPNEIIDVRTSLDNARAYSRIGHIVVFADACRTIAGMRRAQATRSGSVLFPTGNTVGIDTEIDVFYATKPGDVALERAPETETTESVESSIVGAHGFFTDILVPALRGDVARILSPNPETGALVLYAHQLAAHLKEQVPLVTGKAVLVSQNADPRPSTIHPRFIVETTPPRFGTMTLEAVLPNGETAAEASIAIIGDVDGPDPVELARSENGVVTKMLPQGVFYGTSVFLEDYGPEVDSPGPITLLGEADALIRVQLTETFRQIGRDSEPQSPSLVDTYAVDEFGETHKTVPEDGIYSVVSSDLLTGHTASETRMLRAGVTPNLSNPLHSDPAAEARLNRDVQAHISTQAARRHLEADVSLVISGSDVISVATASPIALFRVRGEERAEPLWATSGAHTGSVVLHLSGDRYAAVALFPKFWASIAVDSHGVRGLSYVPSSDYRTTRDSKTSELARARAIIEAAARFGRFDFIVDQIPSTAAILRQYKHVDPVLGVLAAYAYHHIGATDKIRRMITYFQDAGQDVPYDLLMLAAPTNRSDIHATAPAFPLLTQGWRFLGDDESLHPSIAAARRSLAPSLWTTVTGTAGQNLAMAIKSGDIA